MRAVAMKLPLQLHVGFGDPGLDLHKTNALYLLDLLRAPEVRERPIMLLHCYPFKREAGLWPTPGNVYLDVGLAVNFAGSGSRAGGPPFELAPFRKSCTPPRIRPSQTSLPRSEAMAQRDHQGSRRMDRRRRLFRGRRRKICRLTAHDDAGRVYTLT